MAATSNRPGQQGTSTSAPEFPAELVGKKVLLASESLGPVNGVSRTTLSLLDYLRSNGVHVATCAPYYKGQPIDVTEAKPERQPIVNPDWVRSIEARSAALGSRAIGGAWAWHHERDEKTPLLQPPPTRHAPILTRSRSEEVKKQADTASLSHNNPDFRLSGYPLPYNPDLTVAYPFRLGVVYDHAFVPDIIYLASPASVGFQFLLQLRQMDHAPPTLINFQTDLSAYAEILFPRPMDTYGVYLLRLAQGFLFRAPCIRTIFYPSAYVRKYMEETGAPSEKMIQLGRGVDTDLFNPGHRDDTYRKQIAPNGEIIFACICRIAPEKGFDFLAQAAKKLKESGLNYKLLIVGGNKNPAVEQEVRDYFKDVRERVVFTGMLRGNALARAYAAADVFLHCSITETFGLVVLESMASAVPVIARDEGGPSETVRHGRSGFLVPPHDLDLFVEHSHQLAVDAPLRQRLSMQAREQALDTTWDKINHKVALELAATLRDHPPRSDAQKREEGYYRTWRNTLGIYLAVAVVWFFWLVAVIPMLALGLVHGMFKK